jgi:PAS domain-containing protein
MPHRVIPAPPGGEGGAKAAVTSDELSSSPPSSRSPALRTGRLLCAICGAAYPLYWLTNQLQASPYQDPFAPRAAITAACVAVLGATYVSAFARRHFSKALVFLVYAITTHIFGLLILNQLDQALVIGTLVVLAAFIATATYTISTRGQLVAYVAYVACLAGAAATVVRHPHFDPGIFLLSIAVVLAMTFVSVSSHMNTLARLLHSERLLRSDVEQREASEAKLRQSEARANALLDAMPDVLVRLRSGGQVLDVDRKSVV